MLHSTCLWEMHTTQQVVLHPTSMPQSWLQEFNYEAFACTQSSYNHTIYFGYITPSVVKRPLASSQDSNQDLCTCKKNQELPLLHTMLHIDRLKQMALKNSSQGVPPAPRPGRAAATKAAAMIDLAADSDEVGAAAGSGSDGGGSSGSDWGDGSDPEVMSPAPSFIKRAPAAAVAAAAAGGDGVAAAAGAGRGRGRGRGRGAAAAGGRGVVGGAAAAVGMSPGSARVAFGRTIHEPAAKAEEPKGAVKRKPRGEEAELTSHISAPKRSLMVEHA